MHDPVHTTPSLDDYSTRLSFHSSNVNSALGAVPAMMHYVN